MKLEAKKLRIIVQTSLDDLTLGLEQLGLKLDAIDAKAKLNGWSAKQTNDLKLIELNSFKSIAEKAVTGGVESAGVLGSMVGDAEGDYNRMFTWVATGNSKGGICPTCEGLNGTVKSFTDWTAFGLPGSAPTLCGVNCVCDLIPEDEALKNPVIIERGPKGPRGGKGKLISVYEKSDKPVAPARDK